MRLTCWLAALAGLLVLSVSGCAHRSKTPPPAISVLSATHEDGILCTQTGSNALIEIRSPSGIGSAWFQVAQRPPVSEVRVRLYTRGLEEFRFAQGGSELRLSVASHGNHAVHASLQRAGQLEQPIAATDPLWLPVALVPAAGAARTIPLTAGWFEVTLPAVVLFNPGSEFRLSWVDFFR